MKNNDVFQVLVPTAVAAAGVILMSMSTIIVAFNSRTLKIEKIHEI